MSEKKVGKRLLTWVLVLVMTLSLLPLNVLAAEVDGQPKSSVEKTDGAVNIKKSVSEEGSELTLEAWVTDEKSTMQTYVPMDIVLVLDVSGSMDEKTESYAYQKTEKTKWTPSDIRWASETFYAKLDGEYYPVSYKHTRVDGHWDHYQWIPGYDQYWLEANGQMIGKKVSGFLETFYRGDLYTYSKVTGTQTKLQAMQKAVNSFIDSVAAKKDGDKAVDHKIGIVKFSGEKSDSIGNTTYRKSGYTYNHTQVLKGLTDVTTGAKQLKSSVDSLKAAGCTSADYGMEKATELLNKRNGDAAKRPAVVIMFTDGEPTRKSDYDKGVAGAAVEAAKGLKDKGIKVYTIGMFGEANPSDTSNEFNQYMHGVSSNYPNAVNDKNSSSGVNLGTRASGNYYFAATNAGELDKIFQSIGQEVSSLKLDVGKNTVLSDTLSSYFELKAPEGAENSGITVMMANIANDGNSWENATPASDVSVTITDGKTIKVTGFDYKANAVTKRTDGTYSGAKLIITIPIKPNPDAAWEADTKNYPTNETTGDKQAGLIYKDEAGREAKTLLDKSPTVQQTAYTVTFVAGENGRLAGETSHTVLKGTAWSEITVPTPSANSGYKFKDWTPEFPETITESKTYTANFETDNDKWATVTFVAGENGSLAGETSHTVLKGTAWSEITVPTPSANSGYKFKDWTPEFPETITESKTYTANFETDNDKWATVTFVAGENGSLAGETSHTVLKGTAWSEITVPTPSANSGYKFKDWTPEFPEAITESKTYTANFETDNGDFGTIQLGDFIYKNFESRYGASTEETFYAYATVTPYFVYAPEQPAEPEQTEQSEQVGEPEQSSEPEQPAAPEQPGQSEQQPGQSEQQPATPSETPASEQQPVIEVSNSLTLDDGLVKYEGSVKLKTGYSNPFKFEEISLTEGTYRVEVHEHDDGKDNIVYDDTTYFFILTVDEDGSYSASDFAFCAEDSNERIPMDSAEKVEFTNEYTYRRPHHPRPKPTVEIEDDDALGLNTTDHFAYIVGYGNGEVRPQNNITRAEVATIFFRLLTDDVRDENLTKTNRYSDVTRADWYNTAVSTLSSMGIITGYPDGTFRPNAAITRAEFAAIAARFDNDGDKTAAKFSDIATHWARDEISIAYNNGWINGYPNGTFGPQRDITRAETMTLVNRVLNRQPETEDDLLPNMTVWTDNANPKAWYYLAVQEATNSHYYKFKTNSKYEKWTELRETRDWTLLEK